MALTLQTNTNSNDATSTTLVIAFNSNVTKGSTIIVGSSDNVGVVNSVSGITDTLSNTYARATAGTEGAFVGGEIWYATNKSNGANTITITYSVTATTAGVIAEYPNLQLSTVASVFDVGVSAGATTGTALASGNTATTTQGQELVIGVGASNNLGTTTFSLGVGFANLVQIVNATTAQLVGIEDKIAGAKAVQSSDMTMSGTGHWVMCCATFRYANKALNNRGIRPHPFSPGLAR